MLRSLYEILEVCPKSSKDVQVGSIVRLTEIRDITPRFREAVVDMCHSGELPMIMEGTVKEKDGYIGEHGSWYHHELRMLQVDGNWHPVELRPEEREFERQVEGGNQSSAKYAMAKAAGLVG
jgi:hypothetical protein